MNADYVSLTSLDRAKENDALPASATAGLIHQENYVPDNLNDRPHLLRRTSTQLAKALRKIHTSWTWYLTSHILSLLWCAPIIALLVLNFENYIIGASAWCPFGHCFENASVVLPDGVSSQNELDKRDHNLLGALQFVAKAIEVWFTFIATTLVFDVIMILASSSRGLPLGFLLSHLQFTDLRNIANPLLYTSAREPETGSRRISTLPFKLFVVLAVFLTILTNLMGPSTAALVIPVLQYVQISHLPEQQFHAISSSQPPSGDEVFLGTCTSGNLSAFQYACTAPDYAPNLDSIASFVDSSWQDIIAPGFVQIPLIQEDEVTFTFNVSLSATTLWTPNRQVLRNMSVDYNRYGNTIMGANDSFAYKNMPALNRSLSTLLQRQGPSLAISGASACGAGDLFEITDISPPADQTVRCLDGRVTYDDNENVSVYTKCFRAHEGWSDTNKFYEFSLDPASGNLSGDPFSVGATFVSVYFSDKAVYFNKTTDFGSGMAACYNDSMALQGKSAPSCDWDKIFSTEMPEFLRNSSSNVLNTEYFLNPTEVIGSPYRVWCDTMSILNFTTYSLDTGIVSNPQNTVLLGGFPDKVETSPNIVVDPTWILAAWSVNPNSSVSSNRSVVNNLQRTIQSWTGLDLPSLNSSELLEFPDYYDQREFTTLHYLTMLQALSMVDYNYTNITGANSISLTASAAQPIFNFSISVRVWAYGLNSRTTILGVVVSILGILIVLLRLLLAIIFRKKKDRTELELLVAALEHTNRGAFEGLQHEEDQARVKYQILEGNEGRPLFIPKKTV
ncbi:MAG: hypothetical protein M1821_003040 [Bathelium mastoideum]|nr:MAG: hypothetical protein M1821_003040 [Bathelium mastoideum]